MHTAWYVYYTRRGPGALVMRDTGMPMRAIIDLARTNGNYSTSPEPLFMGPYESTPLL